MDNIIESRGSVDIVIVLSLKMTMHFMALLIQNRMALRILFKNILRANAESYWMKFLSSYLK